jgi:hydrogenase-4 component E
VNELVVPLLGLVLLSNFRLLGGSRLVALIRTAALQGALLGVLAIAAGPEPGLETAAIAIGTVVIKGLLLPRLLLRAIRQVEIRREVEPFVGYNVSLTYGALALAGSLWVGQRLAVPGDPLLLPVAVFTSLTGLFLVVSRRKAITQVLGYLVFENGIFLVGVGLTPAQPVLVEMGVLLDLFVGVFVMGIIVFHIQRDFEHIDVDRLALLREGDGRTGSEQQGEVAP